MSSTWAAVIFLLIILPLGWLVIGIGVANLELQARGRGLTDAELKAAVVEIYRQIFHQH